MTNTHWKYLHNHGIEYTSSDPKDLHIDPDPENSICIRTRMRQVKIRYAYTTYLVSIWGIEKTEIRPIYEPFARLKMLTNA